jgi:hypothetical protein
MEKKTVRACLLPDEIRLLAIARGQINACKETLDEAMRGYDEHASEYIEAVEDAHSDLDDACSEYNEEIALARKRIEDEALLADGMDATYIEALTSNDRRDGIKAYMKAHPEIAAYYQSLEEKPWASLRGLEGYNFVYSFEGDNFDLDVDVPPVDVSGVMALRGLKEQRRTLKKIAATLRKTREAVIERELDREDQ